MPQIIKILIIQTIEMSLINYNHVFMQIIRMNKFYLESEAINLSMNVCMYALARLATSVTVLAHAPL